MDAKRQQSTGSFVPRGRSGGVQRRMSTVLCLLALTIQLAAPVVHMWDVAAQQAAVTLETLAIPFALGKAHYSTALATASKHSQRLRHDATVCPVCQALTRARDWMVAQAEIMWGLATASRIVRCSLLPLANFPLYTVAARAPPYSS